jgi:AraC-like DNA-binding protein
LVRASGLIPLQLWLEAQGRQANDLFSSAGLSASPSAAPNRLVSLHAFMALVVKLAETEGPDLGARIASPEGYLLLGIPARALHASGTIREALMRISSSFHLHAWHVFWTWAAVPGGLEVAESIPVPDTLEAHHQAQQHIAALVSCLGVFATVAPLKAAIRLSPHPRFGVAHLKPHLGDDITACPGRRLTMFIADDVLDARFPWEPVRPAGDGDRLGRAACSTLAESVRILIAGMVEDGDVSIDKLVHCSGRSRRTLQRQLAAEGTSFAEQLDLVRQDLALSHLGNSGDSISAISQTLGYRCPSTLTRAVRRWTATNPRQIRTWINAM